jgi:hypothetical protein
VLRTSTLTAAAVACAVKFVLPTLHPVVGAALILGPSALSILAPPCSSASLKE